mgnify:CR=1 FL=1
MLRLSALPVDSPNQEPLIFSVTGQKAIIGRLETCDIHLPGKSLGVSSEHARVEFLGGGYYLFDQGSTNGTALNGTRIRPHTSVPLANGDKLYVGRWLLTCQIKSRLTQMFRASGLQEGRVDARVAAWHSVLGGISDPQEAKERLVSFSEAVDGPEQVHLLRQLETLASEEPLKTLVADERAKREAIREACYQFVSSLSAHHTGAEKITAPEEVDRFFRLADQSLELMLEWIVGCIQARRTFEEKFSAKVTRFFGLEKNPLKHALTPQQAGNYLLNWEREREAEPIKQNLSDTFRDLTAHQLGLVAGVQQALKTALQQLDPEKTEAQVESVLGGPFRRAAAWTLFKESYASLLDNESKLFNEVIYPSLRQGYLLSHEKQLEKSGDGAGNAPPAGSQGTVQLAQRTDPGPGV